MLVEDLVGRGGKTARGCRWGSQATQTAKKLLRGLQNAKVEGQAYPMSAIGESPSSSIKTPQSL